MSDYIAAKLAWAIGLVVVFGLACFFYRLFTGKDLRDRFREDKHAERK
jgi:hypothetical protein